MPPSILFILCDQLRRDSIGHLGGPVPTPNIDRLAREGVTFCQAYTNYPMCTPARAAILTGRWPHALRDEHGSPYFRNDVLLDVDEIGLAKSLRDAGYRCANIGKWHLDRSGSGGHVPEGPRRHGFDDYWLAVHASHAHSNPFYYDSDGTRVDCGEVWEPDVQVRLALDYLEDCAGDDRPFFLHLSFGPPHAPFDLPPTRADLFDRVRAMNLDLSPNVPHRVAELAREEMIGYHANVMGIDDVVGELLRGLDDLGLAGNTIVVFTSDHGSMLFSHGLREKNQFYEESAAVPLIVRLPGVVRQGVETSAFAHLSDIAPTLLAMCGVAVPDRMQGKSFAPLLTGQAQVWPHEMAYIEDCLPLWDFHYGQGGMGNRRAIITDEWKLVLRESQDGRGPVVPEALFERRADPHEMNNLADDPGCQWTICRLVQQAWPLMQELEDPFYDLMMGRPEASSLRRWWRT